MHAHMYTCMCTHIYIQQRVEGFGHTPAIELSPLQNVAVFVLSLHLLPRTNDVTVCLADLIKHLIT